MYVCFFTQFEAFKNQISVVIQFVNSVVTHENDICVATKS